MHAALLDFLGGQFTVCRNKEEEKRLEEQEKKKLQNEISSRKEAAASVETINDSSCFPGFSVVTVKDSSKLKLMQELKIGDEILCYDSSKNELVYSPVFMFGHRNQDQISSYLEITTADGKIFISEKHLIFRQDESGDQEAIFAEDIRPGDKIYQTNATKDQTNNLVPKPVVSVRMLTCKGVYAPFTLTGTVIVDGTLASCYANVMKPSLFGLVELCPHALAHRILAPLRGLQGLGFTSRLLIKDGEDQPLIIKSMTEKFRSFLAF